MTGLIPICQAGSFFVPGVLRISVMRGDMIIERTFFKKRGFFVFTS